MHIPDSMLNGAVCPVTIAVAGLGVAAAGYVAKQSDVKPSPARFAAVTSLIFALQMLNFPVQDGTSGHLLGAILGVSLLGIPFAVLAITIVLTVQAVFFGDGGINALGVNVINMGLVGAALTGMVMNRLKGSKINDNILLGAASWFAVMAAATACSFEVAAAGTVPFRKVLPAMLSVHALIGIGEAVLTVTVVHALKTCERIWSAYEKNFAFSAAGLAVLAALVSPMASSSPDGLEWVAGKLSFQEFGAFDFPSLFPDYQAVFANGTALATVAAGLIGVGLIFGLTFALGKVLNKSSLNLA
ncbi:MAG: energy-coupling factor ABC transporter permease [Candidatus Omnitrophica bacterium]|nr:energy-coupling factor ABC transporter permease [Candidatus Omnitrophota bacterium]